MVLPPLLEQHLDVRLDQPKRRHDIDVSHSPYGADAERLSAAGKFDDDDSSGLAYVNVRRPVLSRRE
jgi:hypothetical protein